MFWLAIFLKDAFGCIKDLQQAAVWGAKGNLHVFWDLLNDATRALKRGTTGALDCDFNQLCYSLGWGLYWHKYGSEWWNRKSDEEKAFADRCLDFYCTCVEQQQKSIFTFLLFWNRATGVKEPGRMIAQMVWEGRRDNLLRGFEVGNE
jgi:hypothetical protein